MGQDSETLGGGHWFPPIFLPSRLWRQSLLRLRACRRISKARSRFAIASELADWTLADSALLASIAAIVALLSRWTSLALPALGIMPPRLPRIRLRRESPSQTDPTTASPATATPKAARTIDQRRAQLKRVFATSLSLLAELARCGKSGTEADNERRIFP